MLCPSKKHAISYDRHPKNEFQRSTSILCACSSSMCVETTSSPPAAGGSSIPSKIGQFELRVLLAAPTLKGRGLGMGLCTEEAVFFFVKVRENLCNILWGFSCSRPKACEKQVSRSTTRGKRSTRLCWYLVPGSCEYEMWSFELFGSFLRYIG